MTKEEKRDCLTCVKGNDTNPDTIHCDEYDCYYEMEDKGND